MKIKIKVKPNSGKQEVIKQDDFYSIKLKSSAQDNKANIELIKLLKKYFKKDAKNSPANFGATKSKTAPTRRCQKDFVGVKIKSGFTSRNKIIEILD